MVMCFNCSRFVLSHSLIHILHVHAMCRRPQVFQPFPLSHRLIVSKARSRAVSTQVLFICFVSRRGAYDGYTGFENDLQLITV